MKSLIFLIIFSECNTATELDIASSIVWEQAFEANCNIPKISIIYDIQSCKNGDRIAVPKPDGYCVSGTYNSATNGVTVAWRGNYSSSAFSHELLHAWHACNNIFDPNHTNEDWVNYVPKADKMLEEGGL